MKKTSNIKEVQDVMGSINRWTIVRLPKSEKYKYQISRDEVRMGFDDLKVLFEYTNNN